PIPSTDYYGLYGVFSSTTFPHPGSEGKTRPENLTPLIAPSDFEAAKKGWDEKLAALDAAQKTHEEAKAALEKEPESPERNAKIEKAKNAALGKRKDRRILGDTPPWQLAYAILDAKPADARMH